jgi:hypothetical protein
MSTYAHVVAVPGPVTDVLTPPAGFTLAECVHADLAPGYVDCTATPGVASGWTYDGTAFHAPVAPVASLAQQAAAAFAAGCAITSTGTPALDATYPLDLATQTRMVIEAAALMQNGGTFLDGSTSVEFPDVAGVLHTFTAAQFRAWNTAVGAYAGGLLKVMQTNTGTLPSAPPALA